ncbi:MAG TPA: hypothetical protein VJR46_01935 [Candidatus Dormibacteraeota bacterium]|nr:hypothetical protein [Candidatus Dormibacteraeota bacterium]
MIFDLDGVLAISEPLLAEAAVALFAEKGVAMTDLAHVPDAVLRW